MPESYLVLRERMLQLNSQRDDIQRQIDEIRAACSHPNLPKREDGEEYMDTCPDCGHTRYCYSI